MPESLPMPNPCPHITRLNIIRAKLNDPAMLDDLLTHLAHCPDRNKED